MPETQNPSSRSDADQLHPDVVKDLLGHPPSWILKWGISLIGIIILGLLILSWVVRYPDVLTARVVLETDPPAIELVAKVSAPIDTILVKDQQSVSRGELLAILQNPAQYKDIQLLKSTLQSEEQVVSGMALELGEIQPLFALYQQQWLGLQAHKKAQKRYKAINSLRLQLQQRAEISSSLERQIEALAQEEKLAESSWDRNQKLFDQKAVSKEEVENAEARYRAASRQLENARERLFANILLQEQQEGEKADLLEEEDEVVREKRLALQAVEKELFAAIALWEEKYVFRAPVKGQVTFNKVWGAHQFLAQNTALATITPTDQAQKIQAKVFLPMQNSGKVAIGQEVNVHLDGYPFYEYGALKGQVLSISLVPEDQQYILLVELPQDLETTYGEKLPFRQQMTGQAEIITTSKRFIVRLMEKVVEWTS